MHHLTRIDTVRQAVATTFEQLGVARDSVIEETFLICDGHYCGRCFQSDGLRAVWFTEEQQIKYYGPDGGIIRRDGSDARAA